MNKFGMILVAVSAFVFVASTVRAEDEVDGPTCVGHLIVTKTDGYAFVLNKSACTVKITKVGYMREIPKKDAFSTGSIVTGSQTTTIVLQPHLSRGIDLPGGAVLQYIETATPAKIEIRSAS